MVEAWVEEAWVGEAWVGKAWVAGVAAGAERAVEETAEVAWAEVAWVEEAQAVVAPEGEALVAVATAGMERDHRRQRWAGDRCLVASASSNSQHVVRQNPADV